MIVNYRGTGQTGAQELIRDFSSSLPDITFPLASGAARIRRCCPLRFPFIGPLSPTDGESPRPTRCSEKETVGRGGRERGPWWCLARVCSGHEITEVQREIGVGRSLGREGESAMERKRKVVGERTIDMVLTGLWTLIPLEYYVVVRPPSGLVCPFLLVYHTINPASSSPSPFRTATKQQPSFDTLRTLLSFRICNILHVSNLKDIHIYTYIYIYIIVLQGSTWPTLSCVFRESLKMFTNSG